MLLFYIRHGDPVYNPDSLTELGHKQAEALSKRLARFGLDEIYCSTSVRAQQTAEPTAQKLGLSVKLLDWCNEAHAWNELTVEDSRGKRWFYQDEASRRLFASDEIAKLGEDWHKHSFFAETHATKGMRRIGAETFDFIASLGYAKSHEGNYYVAKQPNDKRIALFAHEGFGMAFLSVLLGIPYSTFSVRCGLEHSSMTVISFDGTDFVLPCMLQLSNDSHLYKEDLPLNYNNGVLV